MKLERVAPEGFIPESIEAEGAPALVNHFAYVLFDQAFGFFLVAFLGVCAGHKRGTGQENRDAQGAR